MPNEAEDLMISDNSKTLWFLPYLGILGKGWSRRQGDQGLWRVMAVTICTGHMTSLTPQLPSL